MTLIPVQVTFHGLPHSDALEADIRERAARLERFHRGIVGCRVSVELPHRHRLAGRHFHIRIELTVSGGDPVVVSHEPSMHGRSKDVEAAAHRKESNVDEVRRHARAVVGEAFDVAERRLEDFARTQRHDVKTHAASAG